VAPKVYRIDLKHDLLCVCILLATLGCQSGGTGTAASIDAGSQVGSADGVRRFDDALLAGSSSDGGPIGGAVDSAGPIDGADGSHADLQVAAVDRPALLGADGSNPPEPDGSIAVGPDGASQQLDGTTVGPDAQEAQCAPLPQSVDARVVDEIYEYNIAERTGGYFQPGLYTLGQLVDLVDYQDPRRGMKTGRSLKETWQVRQVGDARYVDVVRDVPGQAVAHAATFRMELMRDSGPGGDDVWKLARTCGDSGLADLDGATLDVDMPLVSIRLPWGTVGMTADGRWWRRRFLCMGQPCR
jgi:hypothetical protein